MFFEKIKNEKERKRLIRSEGRRQAHRVHGFPQAPLQKGLQGAAPKNFQKLLQLQFATGKEKQPPNRPQIKHTTREHHGFRNFPTRPIRKTYFHTDEAKETEMPSTHKKEKPWDTDDIDKWKVDPFTKDESSGPFLEESSFMTLFPKYRERYLKDSWPLITKALDKNGITATLDLVEGSMTVKTTRKVSRPQRMLRSRLVMKTR